MAAVSVKSYYMFWSEMGSGLGELGGKPLPGIPSSTFPPPRGPSPRKELGRKTVSLIFSERGKGPEGVCTQATNTVELKYRLS